MTESECFIALPHITTDGKYIYIYIYIYYIYCRISIITRSILYTYATIINRKSGRIIYRWAYSYIMGVFIESLVVYKWVSCVFLVFITL